jgi:hypothetical protein
MKQDSSVLSTKHPEQVLYTRCAFKQDKMSVNKMMYEIITFSHKQAKIKHGSDMKAYPKIEYFDRYKYIATISSIRQEKNKTRKEYYFKNIAREIILAESIMDDVQEGPDVNQIQGVPFDLIGKKQNNIYIIELKGYDRNFNFPGEVQLVRMEKLINLAREENIELKPMLLQINLAYCIYCIWPTDFLLNSFLHTDKKLGSSRLIEPIIEWIKEYIIS